MHQALYDLISAEEVYFSAHDAYSASLDSVLGHPRAKIPESVRIRIVFASPHGWQATATDLRWTEGSCAVFLGDLGAVAFAETKKGHKLKAKDDGQPVCDWP